ncbi:DnaJ domain [Trypanosoma melophagium]|uniref:DnaJ domain n=1 Tax=Trypanosoma melophagium TaxID=715481 RepID=UPI00351A5B53|nr:DnaJ domain [Trypanosoma melophagium]
MRRGIARSSASKENNAVGLGDYNVDGQIGMIARNALKKNDDFAIFVDRMHAVNRVFFVKKKKESEVEVISFPHSTEDGVEDEMSPSRFEAESKWLDCCLREYLERKSRYGPIHRFIIPTIMVLIFVVLFLYFCWPLWEIFIDVEAETHFRVLGIPSGSQPQEIKRAYREAVKRWHPDRNPNCDSCRLQMVKIQRAHDVLLARGIQRLELADKYREELIQLRSLVFFRLYNMAFSAAQEIYYLLQGTLNTRSTKSEDFSWPLQVFCRILTMGLFTMYEFLYISGFNIVVLLQVFYYCVSVAKYSAEEREMSQMVKMSYIDCYREAGFFVAIPVFLNSIQYYISKEKYEDDSLEFFFRMTFGVLYVLAHLYRMTPNLWDNFTMRKCSLPLKYLKLPVRKVSLANIIFTELGIVLDDLFAFTCKVPSVYRLTVILLHVIFLCEFLWLPWDPPILVTPHEKRDKKVLKRGTEKKTIVNQIPQNKTTKSLQLPFSSAELDLIKNLDGEAVSWIDVVTTKYKKQMDTAISTYLHKRQGSVGFDLAPSSNLKEITFVALLQSSTEKNGKIDRIFRIKDEFSGRLLGLQRGPAGCLPSEPSEVGNAEAVARKYAQVTGKEGSFTPSQLWGYKLLFTNFKEDNNNVLILLTIFVVFVVSLVAFCFTTFAAKEVKYSTTLSLLQQPLRDTRLSFLPSKHILKEYGASVVTILGHVFCTVDIWDTLRHIQLYQ